MQLRSTSRIVIPFLTAIILLSCLSAFAQTPQQENGSVREGPPLALPKSIQTQEKPQAQIPEETKPLYGFQGVVVETLDGKTVATQAANQRFNPASTIKLATALVALQTLGPQHRFSTGVWTDGVLDKTTGIINGNLYISGRDPSFHYEHAVMIARQLNGLGIKQVTGNLVVAPGFTMNFSWSAVSSGEQLRDTFNSTLRSAAAIRAWDYERSALNDLTGIEASPSLMVQGEVMVAPVSPTAKLLLTQKSSKLVDILKVLLCYSNNFMAERIGETLGGPESVRNQLIKNLGIGPEDLDISSLSGLGRGHITPAAMMKVFRALRDELKKDGLSPSDIMPVAGVDPGTLQDRFNGLAWRGSVIGKTGTLARTDGGASALVGQMKSANGEVLLFVIMNQSGNIWRFRENQDLLIMQVQNSRGGPKAFDYKPLMLAMQLSDTESTFAENEEIGPKSKLQHPGP